MRTCWYRSPPGWGKHSLLRCSCTITSDGSLKVSSLVCKNISLANCSYRRLCTCLVGEANLMGGCLMFIQFQEGGIAVSGQTAKPPSYLSTAGFKSAVLSSTAYPSLVAQEMHESSNHQVAAWCNFCSRIKHALVKEFLTRCVRRTKNCLDKPLRKERQVNSYVSTSWCR
jgi:hypothetical protein